MRKIILIVLFLLLSTRAYADYMLYVETENKPGVTKEDDIGRSKRGDIIQYYPMPYTPPNTALKQFAFVVVPGLGKESVLEYRAKWEGVAYRKYKLDVDALGLKKGKIVYLSNPSEMTTNIRQKNEDDFLDYDVGRIAYNIKRPFLRPYRVFSRLVFSTAEAIESPCAGGVCKICAVGANCTDEDYNDLAVWESAADGDLITDTRQETAQLYNDDGDIAYFVQINGSTTNSTYFMKIESAPGEGFDSSLKLGVGTGGQAATMATVSTEGSDWRCIDIQDPYTVLNGFIIEHDQGTRTAVSVESTNTTISNMIFEGSTNNDASLLIKSGGTDTDFVINTFFYGTGDGNALITDSNTAIQIYNSTAANFTDGFLAFNVESDAWNTVSVNNTSDDFNTAFSGSWGGDYNADEDGSASGGNSVSITPSDEFENVTAGQEDYHLKSTSNLIDDGTDDPASSGLYTDDIEGDTRTTNWDMGADEYVAAAASTRRIITVQ